RDTARHAARRQPGGDIEAERDVERAIAGGASLVARGVAVSAADGRGRGHARHAPREVAVGLLRAPASEERVQRAERAAVVQDDVAVVALLRCLDHAVAALARAVGRAAVAARPLAVVTLLTRLPVPVAAPPAAETVEPAIHRAPELIPALGGSVAAGAAEIAAIALLVTLAAAVPTEKAARPVELAAVVGAAERPALGAARAPEVGAVTRLARLLLAVAAPRAPGRVDRSVHPAGREAGVEPERLAARRVGSVTLLAAFAHPVAARARDVATAVGEVEPPAVRTAHRSTAVLAHGRDGVAVAHLAGIDPAVPAPSARAHVEGAVGA